MKINSLDFNYLRITVLNKGKPICSFPCKGTISGCIFYDPGGAYIRRGTLNRNTMVCYCVYEANVDGKGKTINIPHIELRTRVIKPRKFAPDDNVMSCKYFSSLRAK